MTVIVTTRPVTSSTSTIDYKSEVDDDDGLNTCFNQHPLSQSLSVVSPCNRCPPTCVLVPWWLRIDLITTTTDRLCRNELIERIVKWQASTRTGPSYHYHEWPNLITIHRDDRCRPSPSANQRKMAQFCYKRSLSDLRFRKTNRLALSRRKRAHDRSILSGAVNRSNWNLALFAMLMMANQSLVRTTVPSNVSVSPRVNVPVPLSTLHFVYSVPLSLPSPPTATINANQQAHFSHFAFPSVASSHVAAYSSHSPLSISDHNHHYSLLQADTPTTAGHRKLHRIARHRFLPELRHQNANAPPQLDDGVDDDASSTASSYASFSRRFQPYRKNVASSRGHTPKPTTQPPSTTSTVPGRSDQDYVSEHDLIGHTDDWYDESGPSSRGRYPNTPEYDTKLFGVVTLTPLEDLENDVMGMPFSTLSSLIVTNGTGNSTTKEDDQDVDVWFELTQRFSRLVFFDYVILFVGASLSLITIFGNMLVMAAFKTDRNLRTISNYFLLSLAVADWLIGVISMPLSLIYIVARSWLLGAWACDSWLAIDYLNSNASVLNLLLISFDRYFSVTRPLTYRAKRTTRRTILSIAFAWIISALLWPPWIFAWPSIEGRRTVPKYQCYIPFLESNVYVTLITAVFAFWLPVTIMIILYWRIWRETQKRYKDLSSLVVFVPPPIDERHRKKSQNGNGYRKKRKITSLSVLKQRLSSHSPDCPLNVNYKVYKPEPAINSSLPIDLSGTMSDYPCTAAAAMATAGHHTNNNRMEFMACQTHHRFDCALCPSAITTKGSAHSTKHHSIHDDRPRIFSTHDYGEEIDLNVIGSSQAMAVAVATSSLPDHRMLVKNGHGDPSNEAQPMTNQISMDSPTTVVGNNNNNKARLATSLADSTKCKSQRSSLKWLICCSTRGGDNMNAATRNSKQSSLDSDGAQSDKLVVSCNACKLKKTLQLRMSYMAKSRLIRRSTFGGGGGDKQQTTSGSMANDTPKDSPRSSGKFCEIFRI